MSQTNGQDYFRALHCGNIRSIFSQKFRNYIGHLLITSRVSSRQYAWSEFCCLALSALLVCTRKKYFSHKIKNTLLTRLVQSNWLELGTCFCSWEKRPWPISRHLRAFRNTVVGAKTECKMKKSMARHMILNANK